jgi:DNA-directed RNA polymerase subunit RPC12/RpoP
MYDEIEDTRQALCERCRKFVSVSDIKYVPKGDNSRMALCKSCLKNFGPADDKKKKAAKAAGLSTGKSYFCARCRYKFKFNSAGNAALRCPYCGKRDKVLEDKQIDADALLKTADD